MHQIQSPLTQPPKMRSQQSQIPPTQFSQSHVEVWAGVECTVNRVGDRFFTQLERNGHLERISDLDLFASLGITAIRYPILWEQLVPNHLESADWSWSDERLNLLRELNIRAIAGLVHHGSGPAHTSLVAPNFPEKLATYAEAVATRYPWLTDYTPVNEPLTTARFSGLYGHWYPHGRDDRIFLKALLNQSRAIVLAMQAIRKINPQARLIQTEDLGEIYSTPLLAYQAEFENNRRWLSFDLLCGKVNSTHPIWCYLLYVGISEAELNWFVENPCPPDVIGINRYLTSDRYLDERLENYPPHTHGGNGRHHYADVEAVRVCSGGITDPDYLLKQVWERYHLPVAVTEVHLGCTREEQLRWIQEIWNAAQQLRQDGADIRAITAWSLLGAYDWNSLLTRLDNHYESGVFDLRSPAPRSTAIAQMLRCLANGENYHHPVLNIPGWWRRPERLLYDPVDCGTKREQRMMQKVITSTPPLFITGATGTLGKAFARICGMRGIPYRLLTRQEMDITDADSVERAIAEHKPWAVINTAGYVRVDDAEKEPHICRHVNTNGAVITSEICKKYGISFVTFSSDLVFDGNRDNPYVESCDVAPLNVYGDSKAIAEKLVLANDPDALIIRTSAFFGPWDQYNFLTTALQTLAAGQPFHAASDAIVSPTYVPDLVNVTLDLLIDRESGIWHLANEGAIAWDELARHVARLAGFNCTQIEGRSVKDFGWPAPRPTYSVLGSERGMLLPSLERAIDQYLEERN